MDNSLTLLLVAPVFCLFILLEIIYYRKKSVYSTKDTAVNIGLALMYQISDISFTLLVVKGIYIWVFQHGFKLFSTNNLANFLLLFVLQDFLYYCFHRFFHRVRFAWASHITHHSSEHLNFSTGFRQSVLYPLSGMWLFWLPLAVIGFNPDNITLVVAINLAFQFFIHTQLIGKFSGKLAFIELIFNTPSHHRAHHATNSQYIDKNYAGVLIIWDKLFGTFEPELEIPKYGVVHKINSHNPLILTFHEWITMLEDIKRDKDLRHLWMPPEWSEQQNITYVNTLKQDNYAS